MTCPSDEARAGGILTIDLGAIAANWRDLAARVAPAACAAVVKADAYGLGIAAVAPALAAAGARIFFVAQTDEAIRLRRLLPAARIAVLNGLEPGAAADLAAHRILPVLNSLEQVADWRGPAMLHVDTGLNRLGLAMDELAGLARAPPPGLQVIGLLSHLACSDAAGHPMTARQAALFAEARALLPGVPASLAASSGIFRGRELHLDLVRPGAALYGVNPTPEAVNPMRPVVGLQARILQVRRVDSPMTVGYGATHAVPGPGKIAIIAIGYADGFQRSLSGRARLRVAGFDVPLVGRVSMDLTALDVSGVPDDVLRPGRLVEVLGPGQDADTLGAAAGTIGYEVLTALGRRYARRYVGAAIS